jgi:hypothetical protein
MFNNSKYTNWYNEIITNAKNRNILTTPTEKHHIIPKSIGGNNNKSNIVALTYREHFICHWLLIKMTNGQNKMKMLFAFNSMSNTNGIDNRIISSWQYELSKKYNKKEYNEYKKRTVNKGKITVKDKDGNIFHVTNDDPRWLSKEVVHVSYGLKRNWNEEEKAEIYKTRKGRKYTAEEYEKRKLTRNIWNKGKKTGKQSEEHLKKRSLALKNKPQLKIECPHCKKLGGAGSMYRWHFDNCNLKDLN